MDFFLSFLNRIVRNISFHKFTIAYSKLDRSNPKTTQRGNTVSATKISPAKKPTEVKIDAVAAVKTEIKTEIQEPDYPNYMKSIEAVINAATEAIKSDSKRESKPQPRIQMKMSNQLPYQDHQYSRITFYGSGDVAEIKAPETVAVNKTENSPIQTKVKQANGKAKAVKKPPQPTHQVIHPKPIIYRFKPNNGLQQPAPVYFVPSTENAKSNVICNTPPIIRQIQRPMPKIYANGTVPLHFKTPVTIVQGSSIQPPIYYLQFHNSQK